jgi:hypothetical protein
VVTGDVTNLFLRITKERNVIVEGNARASSNPHQFKAYRPRPRDSAGWNVDRQSGFISDLKGRIDSSSFLMQRLLFYFNGVLDQFEVKNASADISHIRALLSAIPDRLYGFVRGDLMYDRKMFTGNLALKNAGFDYENKLVSGIDTDLVITGNRFRKTDIPLTVLGNRCSASVASTDDSMKNNFHQCQGKHLCHRTRPFSGKRAEAGAHPRLRPRQWRFHPVPVNITAQIDMGSVRYDKLNFGETHVNCTLAGRNITIQRFSTAFMQGEIFGDGNISFTESGPMASSSVTFNHLIVQDIASITENFKNRMYGFAYGSGQISAPLSGDILSSAKGNFEFRVDRGKIVNTGIQNGLGVWLSELKYKLTDLEFNTIYGNVTIDRDNYIINSFVFNSENIRLKIQGPLNRELETSKLDITLEFSSPFIQDVPTIAISLQNRKKGSWYIIPFIASGKITEGRNIRMR